MPATGDRVPCVYVENHRVVGLEPSDPIFVSFGQPIGEEPTGKNHPELLRMHPSHGHNQTIINGISRIGYMSGGQKARWKDQATISPPAPSEEENTAISKEAPVCLSWSDGRSA